MTRKVCLAQNSPTIDGREATMMSPVEKGLFMVGR